MAVRGALATVEKVSSRRPVILLCAGVVEVLMAARACQAVAHHAPMGWHVPGHANQVPDGTVDVGLWLLWSLAAALWLFVTPGWLKFSAADRRRLDDELVSHHRSSATRVAFFVLAACVTAMAVAAAAGHVQGWWAIGALAASLCSGALVFALQEMRADA